MRNGIAVIVDRRRVNTRYIRRTPGGMGTWLAASVIATRENVCPRFPPAEFGLPDQG